ncbi:hypothetical protein Taro_023860, partial [Colocasia esculenta]|nr:hypothetical protein [Colocasia esculenta]
MKNPRPRGFLYRKSPKTDPYGLGGFGGRNPPRDPTLGGAHRGQPPQWGLALSGVSPRREWAPNPAAAVGTPSEGRKVLPLPPQLGLPPPPPPPASSTAAGVLPSRPPPPPLLLLMDRFKLKLDIYRDYDVKEAVTRMGPGSHWEQRFAEREALSSQIDVDELFDEEHPLNAWVETRQERNVPEFDPRDCSWAEGELDGVEAGDPELRGLLKVMYQKQNIREAEEKDKGMDKGDMKDNNIMQPMSGHLGSQTIVQGLLIYLHFSLPFYRTQILVAHLMEYKEDGDLGLHKNKSLVALVKQQVHTNRL